MKILKFYCVTIPAVISSLLYVHQHIEIVKLNYLLNKNEIEIAQLLDQNGALMYNIKKLESPALLEDRLNADKTVFTMPEKWHIVKLAETGQRLKGSNGSKETRASIFDFLVPKALAQGKSAE